MQWSTRGKAKTIVSALRPRRVSEWTDDVKETYLSLLSLGSTDEELGGRVDDLDLANDGRGIVRNKQPGEVVDNKLVAAWSRRASRVSARATRLRTGRTG